MIEVSGEGKGPFDVAVQVKTEEEDDEDEDIDLICKEALPISKFHIDSTSVFTRESFTVGKLVQVLPTTNLTRCL